jgi:hypothetical protein
MMGLTLLCVILSQGYCDGTQLCWAYLQSVVCGDVPANLNDMHALVVDPVTINVLLWRFLCNHLRWWSHTFVCDSLTRWWLHSLCPLTGCCLWRLPFKSCRYYACTHCHVTSSVLLWIFLCNLIDVHPGSHQLLTGVLRRRYSGCKRHQPLTSM